MASSSVTKGTSWIFGTSRIYYRKFIKDFGTIAAPLTALLKKEGFHWGPPAATTFRTLKQALSAALVLQLPNFEQPFIVDCDASGTGFGLYCIKGQDH